MDEKQTIFLFILLQSMPGMGKQTNQIKNKPLFKYMLYTLQLGMGKQTSWMNNESTFI